LVPAADGCDDLVGVFGPAERLGVLICVVDEAVDCGLKATMEWNTPRFSLRLASLAKKPSTALIQDAEIGVKWKVNRPCRPSHSTVRLCSGWTPERSLVLA